MAATIHGANPVRISIGHKENVVRMLLEERGAGSVVFLDRLRINSAKKRVVLAIKRRDLASGAGQQLVKTTSADSV